MCRLIRVKMAGLARVSQVFRRAISWSCFTWTASGVSCLLQHMYGRRPDTGSRQLQKPMPASLSCSSPGDGYWWLTDVFLIFTHCYHFLHGKGVALLRGKTCPGHIRSHVPACPIWMASLWHVPPHHSLFLVDLVHVGGRFT